VSNKDAEKFIRYKNIHRNSACVESESKSNSRNNMREWNHLKISQTLPEKHAGKARNQESTKNSHIGHFTSD